MSRIEKKHWCKKRGYWDASISLCGIRNAHYANAKRKVTCKTCQRLLGNPLTLGEKK